VLIHLVPLGESRTRGDDGIRSEQVTGAPVHPVTIVGLHQDIKHHDIDADRMFAIITAYLTVVKDIPAIPALMFADPRQMDGAGKSKQVCERMNFALTSTRK
jgi:hypothetical protein